MSGAPVALQRCVFAFTAHTARFKRVWFQDRRVCTNRVVKMQTAGLLAPCGAQAPTLLSHRRTSVVRPHLGGRTVLFTAAVPAKARTSRSRSTAVPVAASNAATNGLLPWQAAMDEVRKRRDLKSIMIIGAGPIVIGQVRRCSCVWEFRGCGRWLKQPWCTHQGNSCCLSAKSTTFIRNIMFSSPLWCRGIACTSFNCLFGCARLLA